ncbi:PREDICTED: probable S-adenosylmethionine-dependent methyltransferase At5g38780 [Prunus mume]|uniref:Probable S-adenosylmethionine-dependent methyltransferase At5g38780 n=1 Tax=Prunus mume TaxID=102107 RepID=A0ABM1LX85_PRUMU|nr:PREDICTED: probable S-adenosylmethionine-dependent methyltransferase At5g38780 [Prunus mume]
MDAVNEGTGPQSYTQNSSCQRGALEAAQEIIKEEIAEKLDIKQLIASDSLNTFRIADLGCATGPNTFLAVQTILEAVQPKLGSQNSQTFPEFQVFFSDLVSNDFNTLFKSLPPQSQIPYFAAGVPGSFLTQHKQIRNLSSVLHHFHGPLFPKASLHFVHSSCALNWLSQVPKPVAERTSSAWNAGKILYSISSSREVTEAYSCQFANDMGLFLQARANELVGGGLMALVIPGLPVGILFSETRTALEFELLGSTLMGMANMGLVSKEKVDCFNLPVYFPSLEELKAIIERNREFRIEKMEAISHPKMKTEPKQCISSIKAVFEGIIGKHFGSNVTEELFEQCSIKAAEPSVILLDTDMPTLHVLLVILKRNGNDNA